MNLQGNKIIGYIVLTFIFRQEEDVWTGECKELGTATFGESFEEVQQHLAEAVELHLNTLEDVGERERLLREKGIKVRAKKPNKMHISDMPFDPHVFIGQNIHPVHAGANC